MLDNQLPELIVGLGASLTCVQLQFIGSTRNPQVERYGVLPVRKMSMLKSVLGLAVGFLSLVTTAQAQVLTIPERTTGLTPLKGKITEVEQVRVPVSDTVTGSETRVKLEFTLQGCLDSLMPLISHHEVQGRRVTIYVTALNAHNEESRVAQCVAIPKTSAQVSVPGVFGRNQIRVVFLGQPPQRDAS